MTKTEAIRVLCKSVWEMNKEAPYDFCGEQREFYLPRLGQSLMAVGVLFTPHLAELLQNEDAEK